MLDSFQSIGIKGVGVQISYPVCIQTARANMERGILSLIGLFYQQLIDENKTK